MPNIVRIPTPLRGLTGGKAELSLEGIANIGDMIERLEKAHPGIKARVCEADGKVRRFVNIYVNDEDIRFLNNLATPIKDGDQVSIVPAIAGG